jgi:hypothetical protein
MSSFQKHACETVAPIDGLVQTLYQGPTRRYCWFEKQGNVVVEGDLEGEDLETIGCGLKKFHNAQRAAQQQRYQQDRLDSVPHNHDLSIFCLRTGYNKILQHSNLNDHLQLIESPGKGSTALAFAYFSHHMNIIDGSNYEYRVTIATFETDKKANSFNRLETNSIPNYRRALERLLSLIQKSEDVPGLPVVEQSEMYFQEVRQIINNADHEIGDAHVDEEMAKAMFTLENLATVRKLLLLLFTQRSQLPGMRYL